MKIDFAGIVLLLLLALVVFLPVGLLIYALIT